MDTCSWTVTHYDLDCSHKFSAYEMRVILLNIGNLLQRNILQNLQIIFFPKLSFSQFLKWYQGLHKAICSQCFKKIIT